MMRAFGLGKTVIVSDNGANSELPEEICLRIPDDVHEGRVLLECLKWLLLEPSLIREIGSRAQQWVAGQCSWSRVANMYTSFLENSIRGKSTPLELKPS